MPGDYLDQPAESDVNVNRLHCLMTDDAKLLHLDNKNYIIIFCGYTGYSIGSRYVSARCGSFEYCFFMEVHRMHFCAKYFMSSEGVFYHTLIACITVDK